MRLGKMIKKKKKKKRTNIFEAPEELESAVSLGKGYSEGKS